VKHVFRLSALQNTERAQIDRGDVSGDLLRAVAVDSREHQHHLEGQKSKSGYREALLSALYDQ
jgi:hypothetical protein